MGCIELHPPRFFPTYGCSVTFILHPVATLQRLLSSCGPSTCKTVVCVFVYSAGTGAVCAWNWHDVLAKVIALCLVYIICTMHLVLILLTISQVLNLFSSLGSCSVCTRDCMSVYSIEYKLKNCCIFLIVLQLFTYRALSHITYQTEFNVLSLPKSHLIIFSWLFGKSGEVLVWFSVWSKVQIVCIWSSQCQCHPKTPSSLASFKSRLVLPLWYRLTQVVLQKRPLNRCSSIWKDCNFWRWKYCNGLVSVHICMCFMVLARSLFECQK